MSSLLTEKRYLQEYKKIYPSLIEDLEIFANVGDRVASGRKYFFTPDGYIECTLDYDDYCQFLKEDFRNGKIDAIGFLELKEILRLNHMIDRLDQMLGEERFWKKNISIESYFMSHPQWLKIERQAQKTLELLRK